MHRKAHAVALIIVLILISAAVLKCACIGDDRKIILLNSEQKWIAYLEAKHKKWLMRQFTLFEPYWARVTEHDPRVVVGGMFNTLDRIFLWNPVEGSFKYFGEGIKPVWSPNGKKVAWLKSSFYKFSPEKTQWHLCVTDMGSGEEKIYANLTLQWALQGGLAWNSSSTLIALSGLRWRSEVAFAEDDPLILIRELAKSIGLWVIDTSTGKIIEVERVGVRWTMGMGWTSERDVLYYWKKAARFCRPVLLKWSYPTGSINSFDVPWGEDECIHDPSSFNRKIGFLLTTSLRDSKADMAEVETFKVYLFDITKDEFKFLFRFHLPSAVKGPRALRWWSDNQLALWVEDEGGWRIVLLSLTGRTLGEIISSRSIPTFLAERGAKRSRPGVIWSMASK